MCACSVKYHCMAHFRFTLLLELSAERRRHASCVVVVLCFPVRNAHVVALARSVQDHDFSECMPPKMPPTMPPKAASIGMAMGKARPTTVPVAAPLAAPVHMLLRKLATGSRDGDVDCIGGGGGDNVGGAGGDGIGVDFCVDNDRGMGSGESSGDATSPMIRAAQSAITAGMDLRNRRPVPPSWGGRTLSPPVDATVAL